MPTLTFNKRKLLSGINKELSQDELMELIQSFKGEVKKFDEEIIIEFEPDRPDLFCLNGLQRALNLYLNLEKPKVFESLPSRFTIKVEEVKTRPYVVACILREIDLDEESLKDLFQFQEILCLTLGRKRRKFAIGIHDLDKIEPPIVYKSVSGKERILPLGFKQELSLVETLEVHPKGKEYGDLILDEFPVFMDGKGIFSFPPIINSERTRVTENTKNLLIELTGNELRTLSQVLDLIACCLPGKIESVEIEGKGEKEVYPKLERRTVLLKKERIKLIGIELSDSQILDFLTRMGYQAEKMDRTFKVIAPPYRIGLLQEIDVIEDIAIAYGYNNLEPELPSLSTIGSLHELEEFSNKLRNVMMALGFVEIMSPIFSNRVEQAEMMETKLELVEVEKPVSMEYTCLRAWLLPSLMKALSLNKGFRYPQKLFEVGDVVRLDGSTDTGTRTVRKLAGIIAGKTSFNEIKGIVEALLNALGLKPSYKKIYHDSCIQGRVAAFEVKNKEIGFLGEIKPQIILKWGIKVPVAAFELDLESLL